MKPITTALLGVASLVFTQLALPASAGAVSLAAWKQYQARLDKSDHKIAVRISAVKDGCVVIGKVAKVERTKAEAPIRVGDVLEVAVRCVAGPRPTAPGLHFEGILKSSLKVGTTLTGHASDRVAAPGAARGVAFLD